MIMKGNDMLYNTFGKFLRKRFIPGFALLVAAVFSLQVSHPAAGEEDGPVPVRTFTVSRKDISDRVIFTGTIQPWQKTNIIPATGGKLDTIFVEQGDYVEAGTILAYLDMAPVRIRIKQAEAAVSVAESGLENARTNYYRILTLKKKGTISTREYEEARLALRSAEAQLQQAEANQEMADYNLGEAIIKAPFSGHITSRNAEPGDILSPAPGHPGVVTLMDISSVKIEGTVPAPEIKYVRKGIRAVVHVDIYPDTTFSGEVYSISPAASMQTRSFPLEVRIRNSGENLKPGFFATVELLAREKKSVPAVPIDAVLEADGTEYLYVVEKGTARRREVKTGIREGIFLEITEGLIGGEKVILAGNTMVEEGSRVTVEEGESR
ncbi:MAG: efflux RND transporter periplasmic adaptor subunit [Candidatus Latescibacteria bacterium]|nr:efflux RND transporter periplasmic adaptor subunit [bacterium]MBD3425067.1 efflux RND transporter periplasmic adaptor subunit [Candidatus Latescibacterota bacterium]